MTRILGIDQSQSNAGFAVVDLHDSGMSFLLKTGIEAYLVRPDRKKKITNAREKQRRFERKLVWFLEHYPPDIVCTEYVHAVYGKQNRNSMTALGELQGIMNVDVPEHVPIVCMNVGTWRSVLLPPGYAKDPKQYAIEYIFQLYGVRLTEHEAEAACMCKAYPLLKDVTERSKVEILL